MNRFLTMIAASACAAAAITSTCFAAEWSALPFHLAKTKDAGRVQFSIQQRQNGRRVGNWSQSLPLAELQGLGAAQLQAPSATPVRFALVRPAGRFECTGSARSYDARGGCAFIANAAFTDMLAKRGVGRPTIGQSYQLALSGFRPDVLDALAAVGYPRPTVEQSVALGIFKIAPDYVRGLAGAGFRLGKIDDLVAFKIHKVSPDLIRSYRTLGVRGLDADDLMAMAIHKVTPDYISSFAALGYRDLPADQLVEMKIFGVTPNDVRAMQGQGVARPTASQLVRLRLAGLGPNGRRRGD